MSRLLLPPSYEKEILRRKWVEARAEQRAQIRALMDFDDPVCKEWRPDLKRLDPRLDIARAKAGADSPEHGVRAGFFHILVFSETSPVGVHVITGPDNESFAYPDSRMLDDLRSNDLQHPQVWADLIKARARREKALAHKKDLEREQRIYEGVDRLRSAMGSRVSMVPGWSNANAGRRGRK